MVHLFQDLVRVWRLGETTPSSGVGAARRSWKIAENPTAVNAAVQRRAGSVRDTGPGEQRVGTWVVYMAAGADVQERDVLEVLTGSTQPAGLLLAVESVYPPRGHHVEVSVRAYSGEAPTNG